MQVGSAFLVLRQRAQFSEEDSVSGNDADDDGAENSAMAVTDEDRNCHCVPCIKRFRLNPELMCVG